MNEYLDTIPQGGGGDSGEEREREFLLTVACHADLSRVGEVARFGTAAGGFLPLSRLEPLFAPPTGGAATCLADPHVSRRPVHLLALEDGGLRLEVPSGQTQLRLAGQPLAGRHVLSPEELAAGVVLNLADRVLLVVSSGVPGRPAEDDLGLVGHNREMERVRRDVLRVADLDVPVLIRGESGTGKELVAGAIHRASPRRDRRFVSVNMAAVPSSTAASELFGHTRGAFTGAVGTSGGYFGEADGGTLFLDEIGETPGDVQALLLRALDSGEVQPVGAPRSRRVDARLISATDADLEGAVAEGTFRLALMHRLAGYTLVLPPLRARRDDIMRLFVHFLSEELTATGEADKLAQAAASGRPWLPCETAERLLAHRWPGNVRELRNIARQLVISSRGCPTARLDPSLRKLLSERPAPEPPSVEEPPAARSELPAAGSAPSVAAEVTEEALVQALRASAWSPGKAARRLGVSRGYVYKLIDGSARIRKAADLSAEQLEDAWTRHGGDVDAMSTELEVSRRGILLRMRDLGLDPERS